MANLIVTMICFVILGGIGIFSARKYDAAKDEARRQREEYEAEIQRLKSQIAAPVVYPSHAETEASRLFQEQLSLKLEAMDACKAMLREAMSNRREN